MMATRRGRSDVSRRLVRLDPVGVRHLPVPEPLDKAVSRDLTLPGSVCSLLSYSSFIQATAADRARPLAHCRR